MSLTHKLHGRPFERAQEFIKALKPEDRVAIIHDNDPDGISAAVILSKLISSLRGKPPDLVMHQNGGDKHITPATLKILKDNMINRLITADLSVDGDPASIHVAETFARILAIDHHRTMHDINSSTTILLRPEFFSEVAPNKYCTAKLAYDLANSIRPFPELDWLAVVGSIADIAYEPWMDWINEVFTKYKQKMRKDPFDSAFGKIADYISLTESYNEKLVPLCYTTLFNAKTPSDVLKSKLKQYHGIMRQEQQRWIRAMPKKAERHGDIIFYHVQSKHHLKGNISTLLSLKHPHTTFILYDFREGIASVSSRRHDGTVKLNEVLNSATYGLPGAKGGGHVPAAGARLRAQDWPVFKERVLKLLSKTI
ncbi:DHH family phosphoesterase [Candidatus Woesearchaeota archaeon]|nr:DHH family phosphoesterase [Candidatus Woesearchaeota archaeon]